MTLADLASLVSRLRYKPGWRFRLDSGITSAASGCTQVTPGSAARPAPGFTVFFPAGPLFLVICAAAGDSSGSGRTLIFEHRFCVPPEDPSFPWRRWLLDRILDVERHETCEWFQVGDDRPFYPGHGPDASLYAITEREPVS